MRAAPLDKFTQKNRATLIPPEFGPDLFSPTYISFTYPTRQPTKRGKRSVGPIQLRWWLPHPNEKNPHRSRLWHRTLRPVLVCGTSVLPQLRQFWSTLRAQLADNAAAKKGKRLAGKPFINHRLAEITSIIDTLLAVVEEEHNVWDNFKLVLLLESLPPEFDRRKAYILANQNITLREAATPLASNEAQILRENATGLEIETTAMTARTKRGRPRSTTVKKDKSVPATATTPLEDVDCWKSHKQVYFRSDCPRKKRRKPNTRATTSRPNKVTEVNDYDKPLQANIASKLLDNAASVTENTEVLKDRQWFIDSCASRDMRFEGSPSNYWSI